MTKQISYSNAREKLATLIEEVIEDREIVIINRRGYEDVALIAASELSSLLETAHLLRSPKNAQRLLQALNRAQSNSITPQSLEELRQEIGFNGKE
ncbi:MAG: type II toxin-antitoxin system prevent-host-death family antitoxin [Blastocatellia bacterium]